MDSQSADTTIERCLQTRCDNCLTVFEVSLELLASSDTRVRCGECLSIFDAREGLRDESSDIKAEAIAKQKPAASRKKNKKSKKSKKSEASDNVLTEAEKAELAGVAAVPTVEAADTSDELSALDATYSDFDLFSDDVELPEVNFHDQTQDAISFDFDTVSLSNDETFSDTLFANDVTLNANVAQVAALEKAAAGTASLADANAQVGAAYNGDAPFVNPNVLDEPLIFNYRDSEPHRVNEIPSSDRQSTSPLEFNDLEKDVKPAAPWKLPTMLMLAFVLLVGGLYVYRDFNNVAKNPAARPFLAASCVLFRCTVPPMVDLAALSAVQRKAFSHPTVDNALILTMGIRNDAAFEQPMPVLAISLSDRTGRIVAKRDFAPKDYLEGWKPGDVIPSGKRLDVNLEVKDPGNRATGFELRFRSLK